MLITLDFETYYDAEYSLRKQDTSTSEYVRDKRFQALCVGVKKGNRKTKVVWGDKIGPYLKGLELEKHTVLCHHAHFDGLILSHHYGIHPKKFACTLSMARALHPKTQRNDLDTIAQMYGRGNKLPNVLDKLKGLQVEQITGPLRAEASEYCATDVDLTYTLYNEDMVLDFPERELDVIDMVVKWFTEPVLLLDRRRAAAEMKREKIERDQAIADSGVSEEVLSSRNKFAAALRLLGVDPPMKMSKPGKDGVSKPTFAFAQIDEDFIALQSHPDEKVVKLVKGKLAASSTIGSSRVARMLKSGEKNQPLPIYVNYCGAHTTRGSGGDKRNYQNLPRAEFDPETGEYVYPSAELRRSIKAPKGEVICVVDSSQIQARLTGWLADDTQLMDAFRNKRDIYCEFASIAYGRVITKKDKLERFVGKVCVLALSFGMGAHRLQTTLAQGVMGPPVFLDESVCQRLVTTYRHMRKAIVKFWDFANDQIIGDMITGREGEFKCLSWGKGYIALPNGLSLHYPELRGSIQQVKRSNSRGGNYEYVSDASFRGFNGRTKIYGGLLTENLAQALERVIVYDQMLEIGERYRVAFNTHDENIYLAKKKEADEALAFGIKVMSTPPSWGKDIPIAAEGGYDVCYSK